MTRQLKWQRNHKATGLCQSCCEPATHGIFCFKHKRISLVKNRKRHGYKPYKGRIGRPPKFPL